MTFSPFVLLMVRIYGFTAKRRRAKAQLLRRCAFKTFNRFALFKSSKAIHPAVCVFLELHGEPFELSFYSRLPPRTSLLAAALIR
jgi:hypothetical protein